MLLLMQWPFKKYISAPIWSYDGSAVVKFRHTGGCSGPAAERSSLLYDFIKRKRYISYRPPFKNILELFGTSFNKTRLRRSWQGGLWEAQADLRGLSLHHTSLEDFSFGHGHRRMPRPPSSDREAPLLISKIGYYLNLSSFLISCLSSFLSIIHN
jgi:hypothetical protein